VRKAFRRRLEFDDLWELSYHESTDHVNRKFAAAWDHYALRGGTVNALFVFIRVLLPEVIHTGLLMLLNQAMTLVASYFLVKELIIFAGDASAPAWKGYVLCVALLITNIIATTAINRMFFYALRTGVRSRAALIALVYRKLLRVSCLGGKSGEVVNLITNDSQRLIEFFLYGHFLWSAPFLCLVVVVLLMIEVGIAALPGLVTLLFFFLMQYYLGRLSLTVRNKAIVRTDERVRTMNEVLTAVKMVKLYAWEDSFVDKVSHIREKEVKIISLGSYLKGLNLAFSLSMVVIAAMITLAAYVALGNDVDAITAFIVIALLNVLRFPLTLLPITVKTAPEVLVALNRLTEFMAKPEVVNITHLNKDPGQNASLLISQGEFRWDLDQPNPTLFDINLSITAPNLFAVCGSVGAGKSSLLSALLGQINKTRGEATIKGSVAYASQQPWILNRTVRENILFGRPMDEARYQSTLAACSLEKDLSLLPAGDQTEIGERGVNLSGGQKARISLARAVYRDADIYLLDDPLSAVDQYTGKAIFTRCLRGLLRGKLVVLVTHQLQYLSQCDTVAFMDKGLIKGLDTYANLSERNESFRELLQAHVGLEDDEEAEEAAPTAAAAAKAETTPPAVAKEAATSSGALITKEDAGEGGVSFAVIVAYAKAMGGLLVVLFLFALFIAFQVLQSLALWWISFWVQYPIWSSNTNYVLVLCAFSVSSLLVALVRGYFYVRFTMKAASSLHGRIFHKVLCAPMFFFDSTPVGRILNRFSKDQDQIDDLLPEFIQQTIQYTLVVLAVIITIIIFIPIFATALVPLVLLYAVIHYFYRPTQRCLKRLDGISRSPIYSHVSATIQGLDSIRAYKVQPEFICQNDENVDFNHRAYILYYMVGRWLGIRLDLIASCIIFFTALFGVLSKGSLEPGVIGLTLTSAMQVTGVFQWTVRTASESEAYLTSVERQLHYLNYLPSEAPWHVPDTEPDPDWPEAGKVEFKSVDLKYREEHDAVVKDLTFTVNPGEKVGVVGRTGAGKSTISLALFRILECWKGQVLIDGVDISKLGLHTLRSRLSVIPQDPVMFTGTVRENLDPFMRNTDADVWSALERVHLADVIRGLPLQLQAPVLENGENFSVGQRSLFCIGRALLRKSKILFLDEATASVDLETDRLIQMTLQDVFEGCTVFAIAHRLNTIIDSDRVIVMDEGRLAEYDAPSRLLEEPTTKFSRLVLETGKASRLHLTRAAVAHAAGVGATYTEARNAHEDTFLQVPSDDEVTRSETWHHV